MLQIFFSFSLRQMIEQTFPNTYVAYSGGDDVMLIGPWEETIQLSAYMQQALISFTAGNPAFTISTGIGVYHHRAPIAHTSRETEELLASAKAGGRNRLALFDAILAWTEYPQMHDWSEWLADEHVSKAFLYRLLGYQRQAVRYFEKHEVIALMFRPHLAYDISRNYTDAAGNPTLDRLLYDHLLGLIAGEDVSAQWRMLSAPITWAALATRGRR